MAGKLERFKSELVREGREFIYVTPPERESAHICFTGKFQGREILWDATVVTLASRLRAHRKIRNDFSPLRQFIQVGAQQGDKRSLIVGLGIAQIDEPSLRKTIIMIRQYTRLHEGRHEYGEPWSP